MKLKIAVVQFKVERDKEKNLEKAHSYLRLAKEKGADLVALSEMFCCPYEIDVMERYAEPVPDGRVSTFLSKEAEMLSLYIVGGTLPEKTESNKLFNTCTVWSPSGKLLGTYRKIHLFDVNLPGGLTFKESDIFNAGNVPFIFNINDIKIGIVICYDIRFPELARLLALSGIDLLILPGAFNNITGPAHWEITLRTRAVENTIYVAAISPAPNENSSYIAYGHSMIVDPFGTILTSFRDEEGVKIEEINLKKIKEIRMRLPFLSQRREDLYHISWI